MASPTALCCRGRWWNTLAAWKAGTPRVTICEPGTELRVRAELDFSPDAM